MQDQHNKSVLEEAAETVGGPRQEAYGHPRDNYNRVAHMLTGLLADKLKPGEFVTPSDAALAMILIKCAREAHRPKRDNRVDIAGYALVLDLINASEPQ